MKAIKFQTVIGEIIVVCENEIDARDLLQDALKSRSVNFPIIPDTGRIIADSNETNYVPLLIVEKK